MIWTRSTGDVNTGVVINRVARARVRVMSSVCVHAVGLTDCNARVRFKGLCGVRNLLWNVSGRCGFVSVFVLTVWQLRRGWGHKQAAQSPAPCSVTAKFTLTLREAWPVQAGDHNNAMWTLDTRFLSCIFNTNSTWPVLTVWWYCLTKSLWTPHLNVL